MNTCGQGLAENAALPAKLGAMMRAMAEVLRLHTRALDATLAAAKEELDVYQSLIRDHEDLATRLAATASAMKAQRDLPMAPHDSSALTDRAFTQAFAAFISAERELRDYLAGRLAEDQSMLDSMGGG